MSSSQLKPAEEVVPNDVCYRSRILLKIRRIQLGQSAAVVDIYIIYHVLMSDVQIFFPISAQYRCDAGRIRERSKNFVRNSPTFRIAPYVHFVSCKISTVSVSTVSVTIRIPCTSSISFHFHTVLQ